MEIKDLISDDRQRGMFRVHRSTMTSIELFRREQERIFNRCWIYLGHESDSELSVTANVLVYRFRSGEGAPFTSAALTTSWGETAGDLKIAYRRAVLDLETLSWHGAVSIIF